MTGAVRSIVQVSLAGVASVFPAASVARTSKVWLPAPSAGEAVKGLMQAVQEPPSIRHSKVEPGSLELNVNVGVVSFDGCAGVESMLVTGAVRSIVQVSLAGVASVLPAGSVARTSKVWLPAPSAGETVKGLVQVVQEPPSMRHSKVEPGSLELKVKVGVVSLDGCAGPVSRLVIGAARSIAQVSEAGVGSVLPPKSVARTSKVWLPAPRAGATVKGVVQAVQLPPSMRHAKVEPGLSELKVKVGVVSFDGSAGPESMLVAGAVRSIVQVSLAGVASVLPAVSVAWTSKVWLPAPRAGETVNGLVQDVQLLPSMRHSNVEPGSLELNVNVGVVSLSGLPGPESRLVTGAVLSTRRFATTLVSELPAVSVATARRSKRPSAIAVVSQLTP